WLADDSLSAWIGPNNDGKDNGPTGYYWFETTFDLTGFDPSTAAIHGQWSADNKGITIYLNDNSTGIGADGFTAWYPLDITSGFVPGVNTLIFDLLNEFPSPVGLRVEATLTASESTAPEPASLGAIGSGLLLLGLLCSFRRLR